MISAVENLVFIFYVVRGYRFTMKNSIFLCSVCLSVSFIPLINIKSWLATE